MSSSPTNQPERPPPGIPEHELLKRIGGGSFGDVWLARNSVIGTLRAVKVLRRGSFEDSRVYGRELRGIRRFEPVSRTHAGLVDVLQIGQNDEQGYFYYVMELADDAAGVEREKGSEGERGNLAPAPSPTFSPASYHPRTLASDLKRQERLSATESIELGLALADALGHLHRQGLLHRDIKPANVVFIEGLPKLADIGLVANVSEAGSMVGTRGYIPPEGHVSALSDLYSLGKVLYECAWGRDRLNFPEVPTDAADWPDHGTLLELNEVILKACDHDPERRYESAEQLQTDLLLLRQGRSLRGVRRLEERLRHWARAGVVVSVIAVLALGGWLYQRHQSGRLQRLADENRRLLVQSHVANGVRLIDDGDYLASLPWFVEALRMDEGDPTREKIHRQRIGTGLRQCPKLVALGAHAKRIYYAEFSLDGRRIVTASADGTARVWDAATSDPVTPSLRHEGDVGMAVFSPDGAKVATCSDDGTARVWNAVTGEPLTEPLRHQSNVIHIAFSVDGHRVLTGSRDKTGRLWDAASGQPIGPALAHDHYVYMVGFSPDGRWMATASNDRTARVWNASNAEPVSPSLVHPRQVTHAAFSPDGRWLATTCRDHAVRLWDTRTWEPAMLPVKHSGVARYVTFSPDGSRLASTGGETAPVDRAQNSGEAMLWDVASGELLLPPMRHAESVYEVFFTPDGHCLLTASSDATVRLWDTETGAAIGPVFRQGDSIRNAALSSDGRRVLTSGLDGVWRVWDLAGTLIASRNVAYLKHSDIHAAFSADGLRVLTSSAADNATVWAVAGEAPPRPLFQAKGARGPACFSADGQWIAAAYTNRVARVLDASTGEAISPPMIHEEAVGRLAFSHDGRWLVTLSGRSARIWEARTGRAVTPPLEHRYPVLDGGFSPDGRLLALGCGDELGVREGEVCVWSVSTGRPVFAPFAIDGAASQVAFSPDSRHLVTACADSTTDPRAVSILNVADAGRIVRTLLHPNGVSSVAYSRDGSKIVTGCRDGRARVWDAVSGRMLARTAPHLTGVGTAIFSPDALLVATAGVDGKARVWDAVTGASAGPWLKHDGHVWHVGFSADGNRLLSASGSRSGLGQVRVWDLAPISQPVGELEEVAQALSGCRLADALNLAPLDAESLHAAWRRLKSDLPVIFSASIEATIAWHETLASEYEHERRWSAAEFHLERLFELQPEKMEFSKRLHRARTALGPRFPNAQEKVREGSLPKTATE